MLWLIPANPNIYDIESAFNDLEFIDWQKMQIILWGIMFIFT